MILTGRALPRLLLRTSCSRMSTANLDLKRKMGKRIGTHSGSFHCDEALGCALLRRTSEFAGAEIVRSRDPEVLKDLDVVIDVGGVYEPEHQRFDHHQRGFTETFGHGLALLLLQMCSEITLQPVNTH